MCHSSRKHSSSLPSDMIRSSLVNRENLVSVIFSMEHFSVRSLFSFFAHLSACQSNVLLCLSYASSCISSTLPSFPLPYILVYIWIVLEFLVQGSPLTTWCFSSMHAEKLWQTANLESVEGLRRLKKLVLQTLWSRLNLHVPLEGRWRVALMKPLLIMQKKSQALKTLL